ncbi:MAG: two-component regulator propeller domain-containing protein [Bacteroidia bacterium]
MKRFYLFAFLFFALTIHCQTLHFEIAALKGLPSSEVYKVFEDSFGFIWLATDAGLCRYDGNLVTTYTVKDGISENVIFKIYEDHKHRIWFSTLSGYFFYYENGKFTQIEASKKAKKDFKTFQVASFIVGENDTLYFTGSTFRGLIKVPPQNNYSQLIHVYLQCKESTRYILSNKKGTEYLIGSGLSAPIFKDSTYLLNFLDTLFSVSFRNIFTTYNSIAQYHMAITENKKVYIPTRNQIAIVSKGKDIEYYNFPDDVLQILKDKDGDLWVCTAHRGGFIFKGGNLKSKPMRFLDTLSVCSVMIDKEGTIWATTLEKGVFQCMNKYVLTLPEVAKNFTTYENQLLISFASKKIGIISTTDSLTFMPPPANLKKEGTLNTFLRNKHSRYYSTSKNLYCLSENSLACIQYYGMNPFIPKQLIFIGGDTVLAFNSFHIVSIFKNKLILFLSNHFPPNCEKKLTTKQVLIGSRNNFGIVEFKNNTLLPYLDHFKELKTRINCIEEDSTGNIWIATNEKGIYCYNTKQKRLYEFNENSGLRSNKINSCTIDENGNIWCGTHVGISKLITSNGLENVTIQNFDKNHGVFDLEINAIKEFKGKIYCASKTALFYFEIGKMVMNISPPEVYVQSIYINDKSAPIKDTLNLNYNQNNFHIQIKSISYKKVDNKRFYYTLKGYDKVWYLSNSGDIHYTNIPYGTYTLSFYGINNDGTFSRQPHLSSFIIKKPYWFTWWFISIELLLFIIILYFLMRFWKFKIEKKQLEKFKMEQKISEFKMTALRSQMNPHFIFNAINSIQHYILKQDTFKSYNYLSKFSLLIRNILDNSQEEYISISQEINTLKLYIELEQMRFTQPFDFILDMDKELPLDAYIPTMLIQPFIENSIWHGLMPKKTNCILELIFKRKGANMLVVIRDNGIGRDEELKKNISHISKGSSLTEERLRELTINNNKQFTFSIVDLTDNGGNSKGTEVRIMLPLDV